MCFLLSCLFRNVVKLNFVVYSAVDFNTCVDFCNCRHELSKASSITLNAPLLPICITGASPARSAGSILCCHQACGTENVMEMGSDGYLSFEPGFCE